MTNTAAARDVELLNETEKSNIARFWFIDGSQHLKARLQYRDSAVDRASRKLQTTVSLMDPNISLETVGETLTCRWRKSSDSCASRFGRDYRRGHRLTSTSDRWRGPATSLFLAVVFRCGYFPSADPRNGSFYRSDQREFACRQTWPSHCNSSQQILLKYLQKIPTE